MSRRKKPINRARDDMKKLGVYKPEFESILEIYGQLCTQYEILTKRFVESEYDIAEATAQGSKKAPIVTTLESLRKDILAYASQLGITPQGLLKINEKAFKAKRTSAIAEALKEAQAG